jgi:homeobox domain-containing protein
MPPGPQTCHDISEDMKRKFEQWFNAQIAPRPNQFSPRHAPSPINAKVERPPSLGTLPEHVHPALQTVQSQYPTQKTRMRTSFDPELELPKLQRWFSDNQHPSRQQIQQYVRELNNLESRRGRKPLDVNNVVYWFKNARAAQKRAELRNIGPGGLHLSLNGYNSSSHSPPNGGMLLPHEAYLSSDRLSEHHSLKSPLSISPGRGHPMSMVSEDNLSNAGSDVDEDDLMDDRRDDDRPESPDAPLSLITIKKNVDQDNGRKNSPKPPDLNKVV